MKKAIIGRKLGMTQIFTDKGQVIPVTVVEAGPCTVVQKKTEETDGYCSVQLSFDEVQASKISKPEAGHLEKYGAAPARVLREFKLDDAMSMEPGQVVKADTFEAGDKVDISGKSKGKGYQGVIKRH